MPALDEVIGVVIAVQRVLKNKGFPGKWEALICVFTTNGVEIAKLRLISEIKT